MQKLILTCDSCSQRMQVPRSAIGRTGMCPSCGATIRISANNTTAVSRGRQAAAGGGGGGRIFNARNLFWRGGGAGGQPSEEAKQRFGRAVDLFYNGKHAEALAIFDSLAREYADNPDIEAARQQCLAALRQGRGGTLAIENQMEGGWGGGPAHGVNDRLDEETLIRVVTEKLVRGRSDEAQLHAAEIACKLLGIDGSKRIVPEPEDEPEETAASQPGSTDEAEEVEAEEVEAEAPAPASKRSAKSNGSKAADDGDILDVTAEEVAVEDDTAGKD